MSNFWQRTLSGAVYVALVVSSILVHPIFFGVLFLVITILAVREYHHLMQSSRFQTIGSSILGALLFLCLWIFNRHNTPVEVWHAIAALYILGVVAMLIAELFLKSSNPIHNWGNTLVSQIMIALPFSLMNNVLAYNKYVLLALFILIWINDSGAYCVGSLMAKRVAGNHKMFPRVSPGKSWEGLIGGIVFALLTGYLFYTTGWTDTMHITHYPLIDSLLFALAVAIFGTFGDLMESLFKRTIGVKDSGRFLPGHGGVLDRFDSLLLATPAIYFFFVQLPSWF